MGGNGRHLPDLSTGTPLGGAAPLSKDIEEARERIESEKGYRCRGCGRRITAGFRFTKFRQSPTDLNTIQSVSTYGCSRGGCDFAQKMSQDADVMELVEYVWLDEQRAATASPPAPSDPIR